MFLKGDEQNSDFVPICFCNCKLTKLNSDYWVSSEMITFSCKDECAKNYF